MEVFDIFLCGPWDQYTPEKYKTVIKKALPDKKMFDPEDRPAQKDGSWFIDNYQGIKRSSSMAAYIPGFPGAVGLAEIAWFYEFNRRTVGQPLENLVMIWPDTVKPDYGKEGFIKMGFIVKSPEEAVECLKRYFDSRRR